MLIREMTEQEKIEKKENGEKVKSIKEKDLCPTCYNFKYGGIYSDYTNRLLFENDKIVCFLEQYPRNAGHTIILVKEHYEDLSEMPIEVGTEVMRIAVATIKAIKALLGAEKVYMCTMCDDGRNHLHFQLIPRYTDNIIGSKLFIKEREIVVEDKMEINKLREKITDLLTK